MNLRIGLAGLVVLTFTGCDNDPTAAPSTTAAVVDTTIPSTLAPSTTTTPTTAAPTTSAPTTTEPAGPTSTTVDIRPLLTQDAIVAAALEIEEASFECLSRSPGCDTSSLEAFTTGPQLSQRVSQLGQLNQAGYFVRNTEAHVHKVLTLEVEGLDQSDINLVEAHTTECAYDESVLYALDTTGTETIVDDTATTSITERVYVIEDGRWKLRDQETTERTEGGNKCNF